MRKKLSGNGLAGLSPTVLLAVLAAAVLTVLLAGAGIYQDLVRRNGELYPERTAGRYIAARVQRAAGPVETADFDGCQALMLREKLDGEVYLTRIYCYDGWMRELFSAAGSGMTPEDGEKLVPVDSLIFSEEDGLLTVTLNGRMLLLHTGEEGPA